MQEDMQDSTNTVTNDLLTDVLTKAGCTPDDRGKNTFGIRFNDVYVTIQVNENLHSITLYDLHWYRVCEDDIDGMLKVTKEINRINSFGDIKFVLNKFDNYFYVSSAFTTPFISEIPQIDGYLRHQLNILLSFRKVFETGNTEKTESNNE